MLLHFNTVLSIISYTSVRCRCRGLRTQRERLQRPLGRFPAVPRCKGRGAPSHTSSFLFCSKYASNLAWAYSWETVNKEKALPRAPVAPTLPIHPAQHFGNSKDSLNPGRMVRDIICLASGSVPCSCILKLPAKQPTQVEFLSLYLVP